MPTGLNGTQHLQTPWNKDKIIGQKRPLKLQEAWAIKIRLQLAQYIRELALFNLAIVLQQKTQRPVQFEITGQTREALTTWIAHAKLKDDDALDMAEQTEV